MTDNTAMRKNTATARKAARKTTTRTAPRAAAAPATGADTDTPAAPADGLNLPGIVPIPLSVLPVGALRHLAEAFTYCAARIHHADGEATPPAWAMIGAASVTTAHVMAREGRTEEARDCMAAAAQAGHAGIAAMGKE